MRVKAVILTGVLLMCAMASAGAAERSIVLRNPEPQVLQQYESLQWADRTELRAQFVDMSAAMRADVWTVHLLTILREHPALSPEQRSLIHEGLGLIATGVFEIDRKSPEWITQGREPMLNLAKRVAVAFPPELARAIMTDPRRAAAEPPSDIDRMNRFRPRVQMVDCNCSLTYQFDCGMEGRCRETWPLCWPYYTCGPWMSDTCDGICLE